MSPRQNRYTPLTQPLDRYPQIQPLIDPIAYGDLEQKVENHEKKGLNLLRTKSEKTQINRMLEKAGMLR